MGEHGAIFERLFISNDIYIDHKHFPYKIQSKIFAPIHNPAKIELYRKDKVSMVPFTSGVQLAARFENDCWSYLAAPLPALQTFVTRGNSTAHRFKLPFPSSQIGLAPSAQLCLSERRGQSMKLDLSRLTRCLSSVPGQKRKTGTLGRWQTSSQKTIGVITVVELSDHQI